MKMEALQAIDKTVQYFNDQKMSFGSVLSSGITKKLGRG